MSNGKPAVGSTVPTPPDADAVPRQRQLELWPKPRRSGPPPSPPRRPGSDLDPEKWPARAWAALEALAASDATFTAEDVRHYGGGIGEPGCRQCAMGLIFAAAHKAGLITPVGAAPSTRRERHGSLTTVWRGARWTDQ